MVLRFGFLFALLSFIQLSKAKEPASDLLVCDTDYWLNISCFLDSRAIPNRTENITYQLEFDMKYNSKKNCSLSVEKDGYGCIYTAKMDFNPTFTNYHEFKISLCELKQCVLLKSDYKPAQHIKPITPYNVTVQYENGNYTFAWRSGYENHVYRLALPFQYILRYHPVGQSTMKELHTKETEYRISETYFEPGTEYITMVYNKILQTATYRGTRSHGSTEIRWKTPQAGTAMEETPVEDKSVGEIVIPICSAVGLLSLLLLPVARMKIKRVTWLKTPNPTILQMNQTQDNFQFGLSKGHVQQIYSEEISTIDMITEITAKQQLQQHNATYIFTQCHTPYVGPLMEVWAPSLKTDSHMTANNPCNNLDFLPDDCDVEETLFCLSMGEAVEGLVSLDDLETSLEISKPSEALPITPNPECFAQNYCTLTNTAIGLIPTFCRVQCVPNVDLGLNGHTSPDLLNMQMEETTPELDTVTLDKLQLSMED